MLCRFKVTFPPAWFVWVLSHSNHKWKVNKLYLTWAMKTQNRAQQNDASVTVDGVTMTDSLDQVITEWISFSLLGIPQCPPIRRTQKLPAYLISLLNEHSVYPPPSNLWQVYKYIAKDISLTWHTKVLSIYLPRTDIYFSITLFAPVQWLEGKYLITWPLWSQHPLNYFLW
jgi:hypothetical protein